VFIDSSISSTFLFHIAASFLLVALTAAPGGDGGCESVHLQRVPVDMGSLECINDDN